MDSILTSIKKLLGITEEYEYFDVDVIMNINAAFSVLRQLGVGPDEGFSITDSSAVWTDFLSDDTRLELVKTYVYLKVKLTFDSTSLTSGVIDSINRQISELEWRINVIAEEE
ncbi:MAG: hypothetical protein LUE31_07505 [Lachnospiraceae bacterium]|nr:hypothetical protein [Lachnospiraceae bacterium]